MKERAAAVPTFLEYKLRSATSAGSRVRLKFTHSGGSEWEITADHIIAATGYRTDLSRLPFMEAGILKQLTLIGGAPRLSSHFESSVPGLYFVGPIAAPSFGPLMRFAAGVEFTARRLARHLVASEPESRPQSGRMPVFEAKP
jgi:pyruvate/2-oxoglutarate dehydrogenase complex dihydrolipoamide dehydrogenase (E3) component